MNARRAAGLELALCALCALAAALYAFICQYYKIRSAAVTIPLAPESSFSLVTDSPAPGLIDLNTATAAELASLPGIGEELARRIVVYREKQPFTVTEELLFVPGIGEKKLKEVVDLVAAYPISPP